MAALALPDLPGPGGTLLVLDLATGGSSQGLAAWVGMPVAAVLGAVAGARLLMATGVAMAAAGAALAGAAASDARGGAAAALLVGAWSLSAGQGWLLDVGTLAWGLAWLGVGLCWQGMAQTRRAWVAVGAALVVLGAATKPTALSVAPLVLPGLLLAGEGTLRLAAWGLLGGLVALLPAWLTASSATPWMAPQAVSTADDVGALTVLAGLAGRQGRLGVLLVVALVGAASARRRGVVFAALSVSLLGALLVADARGMRLQPRHLLPLSLGLLVPAAVLACRSRAVATVGLLLALSDTVAWQHAWADQRTGYLDVAASALPRLPGLAYSEPAWGVFYESSTPGAVALMAHASDGSGGVVGLPLADRRESHLLAAAALSGQPARILTTARCCANSETTADCAARLAEEHRQSGGVAILPGQAAAVPERDQALAAALLSAMVRRRGRRPERWVVVAGAGEGPLACEGR